MSPKALRAKSGSVEMFPRNLRFYLYERAIFHPTKCAAGAMLGTALQLLNWRTLPGGRRSALPVHLRYVGDEVFLHDIRSASRFVLEFFRRYEASTVIDAARWSVRR